MVYKLGDGASDPDFAQVEVLCPLDTANGFANLGSSGGVAVPESHGSITENNNNNRTGSFETDDDDDPVGLPIFSNAGSNDWTMDFWMYSTDVTQTHVILSNWNGAAANSFLLDTKTAGMRLLMRDSSNSSVTVTAAVNPPTNQWSWIAISRVGNTVYCLIDGTIVSSVDVTGRSFNWADQGLPFLLGGRQDSTDLEMESGWSEFRYTNLGRYDENGGVPSALLAESDTPPPIPNPGSSAAIRHVMLTDLIDPDIFNSLIPLPSGHPDKP